MCHEEMRNACHQALLCQLLAVWMVSCPRRVPLAMKRETFLPRFSMVFHHSHPPPHPHHFGPAPCYTSMTLIQQRRYLATNDATGGVTLSQLGSVENIKEKTNSTSNAKSPKIKLAM